MPITNHCTMTYGHNTSITYQTGMTSEVLMFNM